MTARDPAAGDPRLQQAARGEHGVMPVVARPRTGLSGWLVATAIGVVGLLLFIALDSRRRSLSAPATFPVATNTVPVRAPPPLYVPPSAFAPIEPPPSLATLPFAPASRPRLQPQPSFVPAPQPVYVPSPPASVPIPLPGPPSRPARTASGGAVVLDNGLAPEAASGSAPAARPNEAALSDTSRARAGALSNRATTVTQGTLLPAVLETAFNSDSPGFARALVQRDVRGFDGTRVLIPRGSRLIGEYPTAAKTGQKRVAIVWTRLIRPDGVTIALASPASDPLGRGGIRADIDTHFLERFGGVILQSTFDLGVALAGRGRNQSVIVALPGAVSGGAAAAASGPATIPPTLRIRAGTSISVFVARDLDFSGQPGA